MRPLGEDTRGAAAECVMAMSEVSDKPPLHGAAGGFCFRSPASWLDSRLR